MNTSTASENPSSRPEHTGGGGTGMGCSRPDCVCAGTGPALTGVMSELVRRYGPSAEVRQHFQSARLEILKGLRAILDERIEDAQKPDAATRGAKVTVE